MATRISDIVPFLFITLLCVLLVEGGYQALDYFVLRPVAEKADDSIQVSAGSKTSAGNVAGKKYDYRIITRRNLFGPPPGKAEPVKSTVPEEEQELELTSLNIILMGTIDGADGSARAIILDQTNRKQDLYEAGDAIQGALVKAIERGKVILTYNGKEEMLDMKEAVKVRSAYAVPVRKKPIRKLRSPIVNRPGEGSNPALSPKGTPRRVISSSKRPRPTRSINKN